MRQWGLVVALLSGLFAGCLSGKPVVVKTAWLERPKPFHGPTGPDVVLMHLALLERPVGDAYINRGLWDIADEHAVGQERRAILEDNGFRVGQMGGLLPPPEFLDMLTSKKSIFDLRGRWLHAGKPVPVQLGPELESCRFVLYLGGKFTTVDLENAQCGLSVVPNLTDDGRVRLRFTPEIQHGVSKLDFHFVPDREGRELSEKRPTERYPQTSWEVSLAPNEYVLVGTDFGSKGTLGHRLFVRPDEAKPVQRLLVIRTSRQTQDVDGSLSTDEDDPDASRSLPLTLQSQYSALRGILP